MLSSQDAVHDMPAETNCAIRVRPFVQRLTFLSPPLSQWWHFTKAWIRRGQAGSRGGDKRRVARANRACVRAQA
eukprot:COSAG02_NODE_5383_length_4380_cov_79.127073_5_plen_74_part_00